MSAVINKINAFEKYRFLAQKNACKILNQSNPNWAGLTDMIPQYL